MIESAFNRILDELPRTRLGRASREVSAFRVCGTVGYYGAVVVTLAGGLLTGRSLLVLAALAVVAAASLFGYVYVRKWITGRETMVQLDQVWLALLCMAGALWLMGEPLLPYLDVVSIGICVFLAGGRVGCLLVGCCHGRPSSIGIVYGPEHAQDGFPLHLVGVRLFPVQAVEAIGLVLIAVTGLAALPFAVPGRVFMWVLLGYAILRFGTEGLRGDVRPNLLGLSRAQWMSLGELGFVLWLAASQRGGVGGEDLVLLALLLATLLGTLGLRRFFDPRPRLLAPKHVRELAELVRAEVAKLLRDGRNAAGKPELKRTNPGVAVAVSRDSSERMDWFHLSLSLPGAQDLEVLCELAARACPALAVESSQLTGRGVLHLRVPSDAPETHGADPLRLAQCLYGAAVRGLQAPATIEGAADVARARARYFAPVDAACDNTLRHRRGLGPMRGAASRVQGG